ncbi:MAG: efflux RND transporter periplasmic adaptor subunit [Acidobacteria bacterium]|nr:efflux RND transporter periplasmic adaptor subunit [Acidobacteriota bacterium]
MSTLRQQKNRPKSRWIVMVLATLGIAVFIATGLWLRANRSAINDESSHEERSEVVATNVLTLDTAAQQNVGLRLEAAHIRSILQTIQTTGVVGPNETRVARIRALARGRIEKVYVRLGDRVRKEQPLIGYDNIELGELIGQYLVAVAALEKAKAEAEVAKRSLERAQNLVELGAVARAEYERRNAEYKNALASISSQRAEIAKIEKKLRRFGLTDADLEKLNDRTGTQYEHDASHSLLCAPFGGIVIKSNVAEGELVETERELFTIADLSTVWVQADVYEKDIALIREGQEVKILVDAYPGETFIGKLTYVSDFLDPQTRTAKVRCEVANSPAARRLKLEMFATVHIPTQIGREAVMVPATAVQQIDNQPVVFVKIGDSEFQKREVQLGTESNGWVEVTSGLKAGEQVVTQGAFMLKSELKKQEFGEEEH